MNSLSTFPVARLSQESANRLSLAQLRNQLGDDVGRAERSERRGNVGARSGFVTGHPAKVHALLAVRLLAAALFHLVASASFLALLGARALRGLLIELIDDVRASRKHNVGGNMKRIELESTARLRAANNALETRVLGKNVRIVRELETAREIAEMAAFPIRRAS